MALPKQKYWFLESVTKTDKNMVGARNYKYSGGSNAAESPSGAKIGMQFLNIRDAYISQRDILKKWAKHDKTKERKFHLRTAKLRVHEMEIGHKAWKGVIAYFLCH